MKLNRTRISLTVVVFCLAGAARAAAAPLVVVTPGEQNTQSSENGCKASTATCGGGTWHHYPEILSLMLGSGYAVQNNGDGGAVLGCDAATATAAGGGSFCKSTPYNMSIATTPDIVIIGPFGEHDQRIVGANAGNVTALYKQSVFEGAYEGLVQKYLKGSTKIYMMTPIDVPWGGTPTLPAGDDLVKNVMLPAAMKVAGDHQIPVIDTYTAISGTPALVTQYYATDGQVNAAGQMKMAMMILAALNAGGGTDGGAGGSAGTDAGAKDAGGTAGSAGGAGGAAGTAGAAGTSGTGGGSTAGTAGGTAGTSGTTAGTSGTSGTTAGTAGTGSGTTAGTAGTTGTSTGTSTGTGDHRSSGGGGGCAYASPPVGGALGLAGLAALVALARARRTRRR
jgi:hypothetical protein